MARWPIRIGERNACPDPPFIYLHLIFSPKSYVISLSFAIDIGSLRNSLSTTKYIHWAPLSYSSIKSGGLPICVGESPFQGDFCRIHVSGYSRRWISYWHGYITPSHWRIDRLSRQISVRHMFFLKSHVFSLSLHSLSLLPLAQEGWEFFSYIGRHCPISNTMILISYLVDCLSTWSEVLSQATIVVITSVASLFATVDILFTWLDDLFAYSNESLV